MKKIVLITLILISSIAYSQEFGNYKVEKAIIYNNNTKFNFNQWYKNTDGSFCLKHYSQTPIGIKNAVSDVKSILFANKTDFENTLVDSSFLSAIVKDIEDYEMLNITIGSESSEVYKNWRISEYRYLTLSLKKNSYEINLLAL